MKQPRFDTLDALRFFAFFKVFLLHLPWTGSGWLAYLKQGGGLGVQFFFVLSGFLICYLLWKERLDNGKLDVKRYLLKRVLRIWPLYFLVIGIAYLVLEPLFGNALQPGQYAPDWRWSISFLENYKFILEEGKLAGLAPLAVTPSLCIEEHFYILALLVLLLPGRFFLPALLLLVIAAPGLRYWLPDWFAPYHPETNELFSNFDLFGMGMLLGYSYAKAPQYWQQLIGGISLRWKYTYLALVLMLALADPWLQANGLLSVTWQPLLLGLLFTGVVALFMVNDPGFGIKATHLLSRLGRISYGLYLLHLFPVLALIRWYPYPVNTIGHFIVVATLALGSTALMAALSYRLFELPIMRLRNRLKREKPQA